ncbi:MAG: GNAT family N-acetyltransferase [Janthinobacterium lividum]
MPDTPEQKTEMDAAIDVGRAGKPDLDGILALLAANQVESGGMLFARFSRAEVAAMMTDMPLIVVRREGRVRGFLMTATREMTAHLPLLQAMFAAYPGSADAYTYGPICVDAEERGKRLAEIMFAELRRLEPGREGVLFIRRDNAASLRAHARMGMREAAEFEFDGLEFVVLCFIG